MVWEVSQRFVKELGHRKLRFQVKELTKERARLLVEAPYSKELHTLAAVLAKEREREIAGRYLILVGAMLGDKRHEVWFTKQDFAPPAYSPLRGGRVRRGKRR